MRWQRRRRSNARASRATTLPTTPTIRDVKKLSRDDPRAAHMSSDVGDAFVEYFRCISGEHPDWGEYRQAMADQGKCLILIEPERWGPVSRGGFPPSLFEDD